MEKTKTKTELLALAEQLGLEADVSMTKNEIELLIADARESGEAPEEDSIPVRAEPPPPPPPPSADKAGEYTLRSVYKHEGRLLKPGQKVVLDSSDAVRLLKQGAVDPL